MATHGTRLGTYVLLTSLLALGAAGCELIAPFDRSLIPNGEDASVETDGAADGPVADGTSVSEAGTDGATGMDGSTNDAAGDATTGPDGASGGDGASGEGSTGDGATGDGASMDGASGDGATDSGHLGCDGALACTNANQCTGSATACVLDVCSTGCCATSNASAGASCSDNGGKVCDGNGSCVACVMATDCTAQTTVCKVNVCTTHTCGTTNAAKGTACTDNGGVVCDGNGTCTASHCSDGVQDGNETGIDCGGSCSPCPTGQGCAVPADCQSLVCTSNICFAPTCNDGVKNGNETDVDCGGGVCSPCATTKACRVDTDCTSSACDAVSKTCVANQCSDHQKDGAETDVDCGGGVCPVCAVGKACAVDTDCTSSACDAVSHLCDANQCSDHQKDGVETDVDCGGADTCSRCANGLKCLVDADCASSACDAVTKTCDATQCTDGQQDGPETDVDCGGADACSRCAVGKKCQVDTDCGSGACDAVSLTCVASQCSDHRKDGAETDVDCGGGTCPTCANGKVCLTGTDCQTASCPGGICMPCSSDANCGGATPACNTTTGVCQVCSATNATACGGSVPVCDPTIPACVQCTQASQCTTPPGNGCADPTHLYAAACVTDSCSYGTGAACTNGCWQDVCNSTGPSFDGDATSPIGTLDKELNLNASSGTEAANTPVPVSVKITPHNAVASVTLTYTTDNFATTTPITCTNSGPSGADDVWTATIPGQAATLTVRFYIEAVDYSSNGIYLPGSNVNYTYVTQ